MPVRHGTPSMEPAVRVHHGNRAVEARRPETAQDGPAHRVLPPADADQRDRRRGEHRAESGGGRGAVPVLGHLDVPGPLVQEHLDAQRRALPRDPDRRSQIGEHAHHAAVLGQHVGDEPGDPAAQGDVGQALEQHRGQAVHAPGGSDDRRHLARALVGREQLDDAGEPAVDHGTQRDGTAGRVERALHVLVEVGRMDRAEAQVAVVVVEFRVQCQELRGVGRPEFPHHGRRAVGQQDPRRARRPRGSGTLRRSDGGLRHGNGGRLFLETGHLMPSVAGAMSYPLRTAGPRP